MARARCEHWTRSARTDKLRPVDPISQGVLGAAAAQAVVGDRLGRKTWWLGALGGMAPDLDVLIRSAGDPLLALEYHRHFTHSLAFIPVGGLLVAAPFLLLARDQPREHKLLIVAATTLGWATHGLLDAFTSYGTMLWWPFARTRVAWNWISVLDPIYTLILAVGVVLAVRSQAGQRKIATTALLVSSVYLGLCGFQHYRAVAAQAKIADLRGHTIVRSNVQPLLLTNLLWRSLYEDQDGRMWVDALTVPWWAKIDHHGAGTREKSEAPVDPDNPGERDLARFAWFAGDWIYVEDPSESGEPVYCDARYSLRPDGFVGLFCVAIGPEGATELIQRRPDDAGAVVREMIAMLRAPKKD